MNKRETILIWILAMTLFAGGFALVVFRWSPGPPGNDAPSPIGQTALEKGAEIVLREVLPDGSAVAIQVMDVADELVGLSLPQLQGVRPQWRVASFAPSRVVVDVPCRPHEDGGFLGEQSGYVAIFEGNPAGCYVLRELTNIRIDELPEHGRAAILSGIPYQRDSDLPQILDGLRTYE